MGLSIGRVGAVGSAPSTGSVAGVRNTNYTVSNESEVSSAYTERIRSGAGAADGIEPVNPVTYPNAEVTAANRVKQLDAAVDADKAYNDLAERFSGTTTSYGADSSAGQYSMVGQNIDVYA